MSTLAPLLGGGRGPSGSQAPHSLAIPPSPWCLPCRERKLQARRGLLRVRAFFNAPVVIFHLNILSYFAFLCLFAYVLMVDFQPTPSWCEYLIYFWLFSLVCEELRQVRPPGPLPHIPSPRGLSSGPRPHLGAPGPGTRSRSLPWVGSRWAQRRPGAAARARGGLRTPGRPVREAALSPWPLPAFLWLRRLLKPDPLLGTKPRPQRWQPQNGGHMYPPS